MTDEMIIKYAKAYTNLGRLAALMYKGREEIAEYIEVQSRLHRGYDQRRFIKEVFDYKEYLDSVEITEKVVKK